MLFNLQTEELGREREVLGSEHWKTYTPPDLTSFFAGGLYWISWSSDACVLAYQGRRQFDLVKVIKKLQHGDVRATSKDKESILLHLWSYLFQSFLYNIMHPIVEIKWHMGWFENYCAMRDGHKDTVNFLTILVYTSWLQIQACPRFLNQQGQSVNATWIRLLPSPGHEPCSHVTPGYKPMVVSSTLLWASKVWQPTVDESDVFQYF